VKYLLDTHTLLWIITDDQRLSKKAKKLFLDSNNSVYISIVSLWELVIKISLGKLRVEGEFEDFIKSHIIGNDITILNITVSHLGLLEKLPFKHRDPFDRLIICQSMDENIPIITSDKAFKKYKVICIW